MHRRDHDLVLSATDLSSFLACRHRTAVKSSHPERGACSALEVECRSPTRMQLANALCRFREMAVQLPAN
jgi:hypothetical protein